MSHTDRQQYVVNYLLSSDFKKQYDAIPNEFKNNYFFERYLRYLANIHESVGFYKGEIGSMKGRKRPSRPGWIVDFSLNESEESMTTTATYFITNKEMADKRNISMSLNKDGSLHCVYTTAFVLKEEKEYVPEEDDIVYEMAMKLSEDKKAVLLEQTKVNEWRNDISKCYMGSIFDTHISEVCRLVEAINPETNELVYRDEFMPAVPIEPIHLKQWKQSQNESLQRNGSACEFFLDLNGIKQVYVARSTTKDNTRYAICWKPDNYVDKSFQESFESICRHGISLSKQLDLKQNPWLIEITEEEYSHLIDNAKEKAKPRIRTMLP